MLLNCNIHRSILSSIGQHQPKILEFTKSIHLVTIAKSSIIKKYGPDEILKPFMTAIEELEQVI